MIRQLKPNVLSASLKHRVEAKEENILKRKLTAFILCTLTCIAVASCGSDEKTPVGPPDIDPSFVLFPEFKTTYAFEEGYADSANIELETTFEFSPELIGFWKLEARIAGSWNVGTYEHLRYFGDVVLPDTLALISFAKLAISPIGSPDNCVGAVFNFVGDGEYAIAEELGSCCSNCDYDTEELVGRELKAKLILGKYSDPRFKTIEEIEAEITEVRVRVVLPDLVGDD
ncbi:MAG: hypothetical protein ACI9UQ_001032 [Candidatus Krumholzibacteriia bacterium]|jgi:hypothetical protein